MFYKRTAPAAAPLTTIIHGGSFQKASIVNKKAAMMKSSEDVIDDVQIGL